MVKKKPPSWLSLTVILITLPLFLPILYIIQYGFLAGLKESWIIISDEVTWLLLKNTLIFTGTVTLLAIIIGGFCAFLIEICDLPARNILATLISLPLAIPALVSSFTWFSINPNVINQFACHSLGLCQLHFSRIQGFWGIVFVMTLVSIPLAFIPISAAFKKIDLSWVEVSKTLQQDSLRTFRHAILPQLKPAIGNAILLISLHMIIEFGAVSIMGFSTLSVAIFEEVDAFNNTQGAALYSLILLLLCLFIIGLELKFRGQEKITRSGKGVIQPIKRIRLSKTKTFLGVGFLSIIFILGIAIPFIILTLWILNGSAIHSEYFDLYTFGTVILNTLWMAIGAAAITLLASIPLVWVSVYYRSPISTFAERLPFILHAIPALLVALALAKYTIHYATPFYQTYWVLVPAYLMLYLPLAQASIRTSIEQVPSGVIQISRSLGQDTFDLITKIIFPIIRPGVLAGLALCFLQMMKELTATLLLSPRGVTTISIELWHATNDYSFSIAAAYGMALIIFSGLPVFILKRSFQ